MDRVEVSLREAVQMVADNNVPALDDPRFQSTVERLHQAESRGYLTGVISRTSKRRDTYGQHLDVVAGRLTADGRDYLVAQPDIDSSSGAPIQATIDDFCKGHEDLWAFRHRDRQHKADIEAGVRNILNSSIYYGLLANAYVAEGSDRVGEIEDVVLSLIGNSARSVNSEDASRTFEEAARRVTGSFRQPLEQSARRVGLINENLYKQIFDDADRRITASVKAAAANIRNHIISAEAREAERRVTSPPISNTQLSAARKWWNRWVPESWHPSLRWLINAIGTALIGIILVWLISVL